MRGAHRKACATRFRGSECAISPAPGVLVHRVVCSLRAVVPSRQGKKRGTRERVPRDFSSGRRAGYALVAGLTPGLSLKNCLFSSM